MKSKLKGRGLFVFSDPAGANSVLALIDELILDGQRAGRDFIIYTDSKGVYPEEYSQVVNILDFNRSDYLEIFDKHRPDYIFSGTSNTDFEHQVRILARGQNIFTYAFIDHWTSYKQRFTFEGVTTYPDRIWVINELARVEAAEAGLPEDSLVVTSNPYYEKIRKFLPAMDRASFFIRHGIPEKKKDSSIHIR